MGKVAQEWADVIVVTSDNPRTEDPSVIIHDVLSGMDGQKNITKTIDRRDAIACVLAKARTNDVVVVAGKGRETCQIIGKTSFEFNDKTVIKEQLAILGYL